MNIEGQGHFFTIYFPGFVCFVLYKATISGGFKVLTGNKFALIHVSLICMCNKTTTKAC